jgi:excinuclease ABC subunit C
VKGLFAQQAFTGLGPSLLRPVADAPLTIVTGRRPRQLRTAVREQCPRKPGVYGMVDPSGELIYVGKAKNLRSRLLSYFRPNSRDPKAGHIVGCTVLLAWEEGPSEFAALLRELELIRRWRPRFNVAGQPNRQRRSYLCLGREPAPYLFASSRPPGTAEAVFGPLPGFRRPREVVRRLNDAFRLRDCPQAQSMVFAEQNELFAVERRAGCIRLELAACLGPCAAACTRAGYREAVRAAQAFLAGEDRGLIEAMERDMAEAAAGMQFERAAALRDKLEQIVWLDRCLTRLREAQQHSFVYPVASARGGELWYAIRRGRVVAVVEKPADEDAPRVAGMLAGIVGARDVGPLSLEEVDGVLLVDGWFRRYPGELTRCRPLVEIPQESH